MVTGYFPPLEMVVVPMSYTTEATVEDKID